MGAGGMTKMRKWKLEIETDGDISISYNDAETEPSLLFVFSGHEEEILAKLKLTLSTLKVSTARGNKYVVDQFIQDMQNLNMDELDEYENGGNVVIRFSECRKSIFFI